MINNTPNKGIFMPLFVINSHANNPNNIPEKPIAHDVLKYFLNIRSKIVVRVKILIIRAMNLIEPIFDSILDII